MYFKEQISLYAYRIIYRIYSIKRRPRLSTAPNKVPHMRAKILKSAALEQAPHSFITMRCLIEASSD